MDIEQLLRDYNIPYVAEGHGHCTPQNVNVHCPFCAGPQNFHLGISKTLPVSHCWRCGGHSTLDALSRLLNLPIPEVKKLMARYGGTEITQKKAEDAKVSIYPLKFPQPSIMLNEQGRKYLEKRGFDPEYLEREWGVMQTGPVSFLDKIEYSHRILIPIYWNGKLVSFQTRDITGKSNRKYLACPMQREVINHKNILYGKQEHWQKAKALIVVEGVFDVWRLGRNAVATFGISFKMEQVLQLAKAHDKFFVVFDNEPQAQEQARKLATKLKALGKMAFVETVEGDPGEMKQEEADHFVRQLIGKEGIS